MFHLTRRLALTFLLSISALIYTAVSTDVALALEPVEVAKLLASDGESGDEFGRSVDVSGDIAVIGTFIDQYQDSGTGSAYIFTRNGNEWIEHSRLVGSGVTERDFFGYSVSIDGDTAVIGAYLDDEIITKSGAVYVFIHDGENWIEQTKLKSPIPVETGGFGVSVEIVGDTILVGELNTARAYVFVRNNGTWTQQAILSVDLPATSSFGESLSLDGNTAVVGAYRYTIGGYYNVGAAYVFVRNSEGWSQQAMLRAVDANAYDYFGKSVSVSGDTLIIGASGVDGDHENIGAVYVFIRNGETWTQSTKLVTSDGEMGDRFGWSSILKGDIALIGAFGDVTWLASDGHPS